MLVWWTCQALTSDHHTSTKDEEVAVAGEKADGAGIQTQSHCLPVRHNHYEETNLRFSVNWRSIKGKHKLRHRCRRLVRVGQTHHHRVLAHLNPLNHLDHKQHSQSSMPCKMSASMTSLPCPKSNEPVSLGTVRWWNGPRIF